MSSTETADSTGFTNVRPRIFMDGEERLDLHEAVQSTEVCLPLHGRAHAELRLVNWSSGDFAFGNIGLGRTIGLVMGESAEEAMFEGEVTGIEERYGHGAPQIVLLVEDKLHRLARERHNRRFEQMTVDSVISEVLTGAGLSADAQVGSATATWLQMNESSLAFLMRLVAPYGIGLRFERGQVRARPEEDDPEPLSLNPNRGTAKSVRIIADLNHQPSAITVHGYDLATDQAVSKEAASLDPGITGTLAADELSRLSWQTASTIPHPFARSQAEADGLAEGQFARAASRFLYGDIICAGAPTLRSGREVELSGLSPQLNGRFRVADCRHVFGATGYETRIKVQRAFLS